MPRLSDIYHDLTDKAEQKVVRDQADAFVQFAFDYEETAKSPTEYDFGEAAIAFRGYCAPAPQKDRERLFVSSSLDEYIEYSTKDRLGKVKGVSTSPSTIWLKRSATIYSTRIRSLNDPSLFLQGAIGNIAQQSANGSINPIVFGNAGCLGNWPGQVYSIIGFGCGGTTNQNQTCS